MKNENKGQIRIIEAFLAVLIIFSSLVISANLTPTQSMPNNQLKRIGLRTLMKLDSDGSLGKYIDEGNWTALRDALNLALPAGTSFNLTVYDEEMRQVNTVVISNGGFGGREVSYVEYVCASQGSVFHCYVIHLYLAVVS
ncbi:hypothetical protein DRO45_02435 [Candidatus Bathyarchaeota archaeon]|nr:MAG: hypothetical protein DRO45_02435 [Candidatus Bathyarchaeota archaeon]